MSYEQITPADVLRAYAAGLFPMAESRDDPELHWFDPSMRGVLPLDGFRMSRRLARTIRHGEFSATLNRDFAGVMDGCAARKETWINETIRDLYGTLHEVGHAHSLEVWRDGALAGGVYGVTLGTAFFGESMFSARRDASKVALAWLVDHLARSGFTLFDTQFTTPHLISLGAVDMPRDVYHGRLALALEHEADIGVLPIERDPQAVVQRITQTS